MSFSRDGDKRRDAKRERIWGFQSGMFSSRHQSDGFDELIPGLPLDRARLEAEDLRTCTLLAVTPLTHPGPAVSRHRLLCGPLTCSPRESDWRACVCVACTQTIDFARKDWTRRPDLNRGWRFRRHGRDVHVVDSSCFLVGPTPRSPGVGALSFPTCPRIRRLEQAPGPIRSSCRSRQDGRRHCGACIGRFADPPGSC
jgi:hypothetical protein